MRDFRLDTELLNDERQCYWANIGVLSRLGYHRVENRACEPLINFDQFKQFYTGSASSFMKSLGIKKSAEEIESIYQSELSRIHDFLGKNQNL